jgi:hypothetical protein
VNEDLDKVVVARRNVIENHFSDEFIRTRCEDLKQQMSYCPALYPGSVETFLATLLFME